MHFEPWPPGSKLMWVGCLGGRRLQKPQVQLSANWQSDWLLPIRKLYSWWYYSSVGIQMLVLSRVSRWGWYPNVGWVLASWYSAAGCCRCCRYSNVWWYESHDTIHLLVCTCLLLRYAPYANVGNRMLPTLVVLTLVFSCWYSNEVLVFNLLLVVLNSFVAMLLVLVQLVLGTQMSNVCAQLLLDLLVCNVVIKCWYSSAGNKWTVQPGNWP